MSRFSKMFVLQSFLRDVQGYLLTRPPPAPRAASALKVRSMATPPPSDSAVPPPEGAAEAAAEAAEAAKAVAGSGSGGWLLNRKIV